MEQRLIEQAAVRLGAQVLAKVQRLRAPPAQAAVNAVPRS
jgi:hypothetical protein